MGKHCFCAKLPEGEDVQAGSSNARQLCVKHCARSSAQHSTKCLPSEDVTFAYCVEERNRGAKGGSSQQMVTVESRQKEDGGARLLATTSSELHRLSNFRQESRDALPGIDPSSLASQQQEKQQSVLQVAPMAVRFPTYGEHFRYELSKFKAFWSCDLHYRDWRQVFAASPFPTVVPPNRLLTLRVFICMAVVVLEVVATVHSCKQFGWPIFLYFTSTYCILVSIFWVLITVVSFHALITWKEPLRAEPTSPPDSLSRREESTATAARTQNVASASTTGHSSEQFCCEAFSTNDNGTSTSDFHDSHVFWPTTVQAGDREEGGLREQPLGSFVSVRVKKVLGWIKSFWRIQGYKDLLADRRFCVKGIIFAPNPTCPQRPRENIAADCNCGSSCTCRQVTDHALRGVDGVQRPIVCSLWVLHSLQLIGSAIVFIVYFSSLRANGTSFTEFWYSVWRHSVLIIINVLHSLLLTRIPFPMRHVGFAYIICVLYFIVQVFVFALELSNGDGDRGCVYRVFTLRKPVLCVAYGFVSLVLVAIITVSWWSLLRQRSVDTDPPPSVSVPAIQLLEKEESADAGEAEQLGQKEQSCFGAQLLRFWGRGKTHKPDRSAKEASS